MQHDNAFRAKLSLGLIALVTLTTPALAHHPMGGAMPQTVWQGLLSGLGHPVIEADHLVFLICLGLLTSLVDQGRLRLIVPFVTLSLLGVYLHAMGWFMPLPEVWIGLSLLVMAGLLLRRLSVNVLVATGFCVVAGLVHGYAFGEAVVGVRDTALASYLVGLGLVQSAMLWLVAIGTRRLVPVLKRRLLIAGAASSGLLGTLALVGSAI